MTHFQLYVTDAPASLQRSSPGSFLAQRTLQNPRTSAWHNGSDSRPGVPVLPTKSGDEADSQSRKGRREEHGGGDSAGQQREPCDNSTTGKYEDYFWATRKGETYRMPCGRSRPSMSAVITLSSFPSPDPIVFQPSFLPNSTRIETRLTPDT